MTVFCEEKGCGRGSTIFATWKFLKIVSTTCAIILAPAAVLVKILQVSFVSDSYYKDWSLEEWFLFAGFINQLTGIIPHLGRLQIDAAFELKKLHSFH